MSPLTSPLAASSFSSRRMILPLRVLGRESVKRIWSGLARLPICLPTQADQFLLEFVGRLTAGFQRDERGDALALDLVGHRTHGRLGDRVVGDQGALDLGGPQAVAGDVDHVVDSAHDPEVAIVVAAGAVAGEVASGHVATSTVFT